MDNPSILGPDGKSARAQGGDLVLMYVVWRGSSVMIFDNPEGIMKLGEKDRQRVFAQVQSQLRAIFHCETGN